MANDALKGVRDAPPFVRSWAPTVMLKAVSASTNPKAPLEATRFSSSGDSTFRGRERELRLEQYSKRPLQPEPVVHFDHEHMAAFPGKCGAEILPR